MPDIRLLLLAGCFVLLLFARHIQAASAPPALPTVESVDLARYMGTWYEIARFEQFFQKGCVASTATYRIRTDGDVEVINRCINESDGKLREATGHAWVVDPTTNSRLKVSFFWPFRGDYWIIDLGKEYEYVAIGAPNRKYLWILARQPLLDASVYAGIVERAARNGFAVENLIRKGADTRKDGR
jgi:apolipoprotein D and lipocalin family protein